MNSALRSRMKHAKKNTAKGKTVKKAIKRRKGNR